VAQIKKGTASLEQLQRLKDDLEASEYLGYDYKLFNPFDDEATQNLAKVADEATPKKETAQSAKAQLRSHFSGKKLTDTQRAELRAIIEKEYNITPIKEFGTNYAEYYHDGFQAILKLETERSGQVAGAFHKEGLGDIDLVWGDDKIGLKKIIERHADDFKEFGGVAKGLNKIVEYGEVVSKNGVKTIWHKHGDDYFLVGLSKGFNGKGENEWIITSYKKTKGAIPDEVKGITANLSAYSDEFKGELTSSHPPFTNNDIIPQNKAKDTKEAEHEASELYFALAKDAGGGKGYVMLSEKETIKHVIKKYGSTEDHAIKTRERLRKNIETLAGITPIKEFGTNYAEFYHDGNGAVKKLLIEKQGQVAGAFYKDGLGDIDLVWGDDKIGLKKIIERHADDFKEFGGVAKGLNKIVEYGEVVNTANIKTIIYNTQEGNYRLGLSQGWHGKGENEWIITAYKKEPSHAESRPSRGLKQNGTNLSANGSDEIIPQNEAKELSYDENLKNWHKDSHEITKNKDGTPKVFYHGSSAKNITEFKDEFDKSGYGFWFADKEYAKNHSTGGFYEVYLNIKKPLDLREKNANYPFEIENEILKRGLGLEPYQKNTRQTKEFLKQKGYDGVILDGDEKGKPFIIAFDSSQIKHVKNKGTFNPNDKNIYHANLTIGGGLFGGSLNGVSRDENGDVSLDFDNFIKGFFGGAVGAKLASAGLKKSAPNLYKKFMGYANKYPKMAQTNPELLGTMLRSGRDSELKELERNLR
ncbi:hypothetical protein NYG85_11315, partial [Campylobacter sp. PS10]|nr:hypothetical protein [Campylobacter gastrosuis]